MELTQETIRREAVRLISSQAGRSIYELDRLVKLDIVRNLSGIPDDFQGRIRLEVYSVEFFFPESAFTFSIENFSTRLLQPAVAALLDKAKLSPRRVIIESPFKAAGPEASARNILYLRAALRDSLLRGEAPFASHGLYTLEGVLDDGKPEEREIGMAAGWEWYNAAHAAVVYDDLGVSPGMDAGIARARAHGLPVEHRQIPGWSTAAAVPNPGSPEAILQGCTCPRIDNHNGQGRPGLHGPRFVRDLTCSLHFQPLEPSHD